MESAHQKPVRKIIFSIILAIFPLILFAIGFLIAQVLGVKVTAAGPPNIPVLGEILYLLGFSHLGLLVTIPIGLAGVIAGLIQLIKVASSKKGQAGV